MYLMTDMVLLRVLGIVANGLDMFYCFLVAETPLWLNIRWGAFYVLVNVVQLGQLYWDQRSLDLDPVQSEIFEQHFRSHGMTHPQFTKLYRLASSRVLPPGAEVVAQAADAASVSLLLDGTVRIEVDGDDLAEHTRHVVWFGESEPLDLSIFD